MQPITVRLPRYAPAHAYANRLLRVDLSNMTVRAQETTHLLPDAIGGRGLGARLAWDEYPHPVEPFAPENPLMVLPGALTGSRAPYAGRTEVCTFSPQAWPYGWFTRSNLGGHFGGELKRAGYDGIVVTGASETPVRLRIRDDEVSILPASDWWGLDTFETLEAVAAAEGPGARALVIGPAGERLSRIATIQTATSSACGHGGFGAVMGSKKLKAISVVGSGSVALADPARMLEVTRALARDLHTTEGGIADARAENERLAAEGGGTARLYACTEGCLTPCGLYYQDVPGRVHQRTWSGHWFCVSPIMAGWGEDGPVSRRGVYDWRLGLRGGFEANVLSNRYGINQWELVIGMVPWLAHSQRDGLIAAMNGMPMDWRSPEFWDMFLHAIAYREGLGDALAEGGWRAARSLNLGADVIRRFYTGWGFPGHWDGHGDFANYIVFPFWLVAALQWATDTRDPIPSGHGYVSRVMRAGPFSRVHEPDKAVISWEELRGVAQRVYGDADALDPAGEYKAKAVAAYYHTKRSVMKDCLPSDDFVFPLLYWEDAPDRIPVVAGVAGPSMEHHLFQVGTGVCWDEAEWERAAERVYTLERATQVRHWGRSRKMDETVLPAFEYPENWPSPLLGVRRRLERARFTPVMDEYYRLHGWDAATGWPTPERLAQLGLPDAHAEMVAGAQRALAALPPPPGEEPVPAVFVEDAEPAAE
ncbi:MAG: aldehyde ferredoxin oxidoreductase N-terminal domain-containing protein [Chloroflexota bacterium]